MTPSMSHSYFLLMTRLDSLHESLLYLDMIPHDSFFKSHLYLDLRTSDDSFHESSLYLAHDSHGL